MLTLKQFTEHMREIKRLSDDIENAHKAMQRLDSDFGGMYIGRATTLPIAILADAMEDEYQWIEYFIYDCEWGKKKMLVKDGEKKIYLRSIKGLYNFIHSHYVQKSNTKERAAKVS